ncbi:hypothetical protein EDC56_0686 [Sinobacterium caligoides]|uniref:Uncharacterized protein n=1 Tax=Sinobacterium caligoides TaxID=933926 RepID=A0A3N2DZF0_9GAMM|nr:hypothetical protein EDC56_0686 [Sinobacterium caligoides]
MDACYTSTGLAKPFRNILRGSAWLGKLYHKSINKNLLNDGDSTNRIACIGGCSWPAVAAI